jgi:competence protein ComEA
VLMQLNPKERAGYALLGVLLLCILGVLGWRSSHRPAQSADVALRMPKDRAALKPEQIWVHVAGAVRKPGVYSLPAGARTLDAVAAAGGESKTADLDAINLAAKVADGQQVRVPEKQPQNGLGRAGAAAKQGKVASGMISLNSATIAELEQLPGVGPATAQKIVDYRTQHGAFSTIEQLKEVGGIGDKKLGRIRDHLSL